METNKKEFLKTIKFLKIISEENRLKILCMLSVEEKCVCEIWQHLELPQNLISHHLKVLKDLKLINRRKEGLKVFYSINQEIFDKYMEDFNRLLSDK